MYDVFFFNLSNRIIRLITLLDGILNLFTSNYPCKTINSIYHDEDISDYYIILLRIKSHSVRWCIFVKTVFLDF